MEALFPQAHFIDWLTIYGIAAEPIVFDNRHYRQNGDTKTSMWFREVQNVDIYLDGRWQSFCVLCQNPTTPMMSRATVSIKFANHILYRPDWYSLVLDVLRLWSVSSTSVARLDLALDCLRLPSGLSPAVLARGLVDYTYLRKGSRKLSVHAMTPYKILPNKSVDVRHERSGIQTVTFGTHASVCQFQLYNKTEELRQQSIGGYCPKEYIRDCWKQAGVYSPQQDTWRIELRLTSKAHTLINTVTGEDQPIDLYSLRPENLENVFRAAFARWAVIYDTCGASVSSWEHTDRMRRVPICATSNDFIIQPRVKAKRNGLPHSSYIKGVMTTLKRFRTQFDYLLPDHADAYIMQDTEAIIRCIYSDKRSDERRAEMELSFQRAAMQTLDIIEMRPQLTDSEAHWYAYYQAIKNHPKFNFNNYAQP